MARPIDKTNLGYLGTDYQYQLVKCFIEEPSYFQEVSPIVDQNTFTEPLLKRFVGALKDYHSIHNVVPSYSTLLYVLKNSYGRTETDIEEWDALVKVLRDTSPEGCEYVKESATKFFRQQNMVKVANSIIQKAADGDGDHYDECIKMMQDAINIGQDDDMGINPYDIKDDVMREDSQTPVPTGIKGLDDILNGGLDKKKLGVVIGSAGFGKTTFSTAIASYAATCATAQNGGMGYKVVQICFEDDIKDLSKKHFSRITQIEAKDLVKPSNIDLANRELDDYLDKEMFKRNLLIKKYKTNTKTVEDLRNYLKRLINSGFKPDMVIVDYFECLKLKKTDKNDTKWDMQENTMRELERLAEEFDIALWIMTQGNKESFLSTVVDMSKAGGSITKVQIGHVIISIARSIEDQDNNRATLTILKNRQGKSGKIWDGIMFNNGTSTISCDEVQEYDNALTWQEDTSRRIESRRNAVGRAIVANSGYTQQPTIAPMVPPQDYQWDTGSFEREGQQPIAGVLPKKKVPEVEKTREYFGLVTGDTFADEAERQLGTM